MYVMADINTTGQMEIGSSLGEVQNIQGPVTRLLPGSHTFQNLSEPGLENLESEMLDIVAYIHYIMPTTRLYVHKIRQMQSIC